MSDVHHRHRCSGLGRALPPRDARAGRGRGRRSRLPGGATRADAAQEKGTPRATRPRGFRLTVLGTTDTHGNVLNWDYFKDAEYDDCAHNDIGLAKIATLVKADARRAGRGEHAAARRRRHHPGHAAGLLLRQGRPDHRRLGAPDGQGHERHRLRRGRAGQPRVQLRPRHPAHLRVAVRLPAAQRQLGRLDHRRAGLPAAPDPQLQGPGGGQAAQGRHPRPGDARRRHLGQGQRRGPACASPASSSRPRSGCRGSSRPAATWSSSRATPGRRPARPTATRCRSPRTPPASSPRRSPGIDAILVGHAHVEIVEQLVDQQGHARQEGPADRAAQVGHAPVRHGLRPRPRRAAAGRSPTAHVDAAQRQHRAGGPRGRRPGRARTTRSCAPTSTRSSAPAPPPCRRRRRGSRTPRRSTSSTTCRPTPCAPPSPARPTRRLPVLSIAAPFNRDAAIPAGDVTVRDVAGLYIYDNTLLGHPFTGAAGQGLPRVLGGLLQDGHRHRALRARRRDQRRDRRPPPPGRRTTTTT